jgi:hypothetical protein
VFPTEYRLNTLKQIRRQFPGSAYDDYSYAYNTEPAYFGNSLVATRIAKHVIGTPPAAFSALLFVFLRKRE